MLKLAIIWLTVLKLAHCTNEKFPDDFLFGVASSAYQIEGGHDAKGKGESIWDHDLRLNPTLVLDSTNGNIACDSYHKYKDDVSLIRDLGVDFYRFSISWSRIMPTGLPNRINPDGIRYYNNLIDELLAHKIQPMVTMYHWDLPQALQELGGWTNPLMVDYFQDYARVLFDFFGDRVKLWITFNVSLMGYGGDDCPPAVNQSGIAEYLYFKHVVLAHARVYRLYEAKYRQEQHGQVGITTDGRWYEPLDHQEPEAAARARNFHLGLLLNPIFGNGDFPEDVKRRVQKLSEDEGFFRSRLPVFSREDMGLVKGAADFLGVNLYTTYLVGEVVRGDETSFDNDMGVLFLQDENWPKSGSEWLRVVPWGARNVLKWIKDTYDDPAIFITENGFSDQGELDDVDRIRFYQQYLKALLESIHEDKVRIKGYAAWSLMDNFEWLVGYTEKFGLYQVDFNDPERKRTPKASARWYKNVIKHRRLIQDDNVKSEL